MLLIQVNLTLTGSVACVILNYVVTIVFTTNFLSFYQVGPGAPGKLVTGRKVATINEDILTKADPGTSAIHDDTDETKTKVTTNETDPVTWTQNQQKLLEMALQQYPKTTPDRWTCIARSVPGMAKVRLID